MRLGPQNHTAGQGKTKGTAPGTQHLLLREAEPWWPWDVTGPSGSGGPGDSWGLGIPGEVGAQQPSPGPEQGCSGGPSFRPETRNIPSSQQLPTPHPPAWGPDAAGKGGGFLCSLGSNM